MAKVEKNSDLSLRLAVQGDDGIAQLSSTFNNMLAKFSGSLTHVANANTQLSVATTKISEVAKQTSSTALQQSADNRSSIAQRVSQNIQTIVSLQIELPRMLSKPILLIMDLVRLAKELTDLVNQFRL